jgi:hypothetical protein
VVNDEAIATVMSLAYNEVGRKQHRPSLC